MPKTWAISFGERERMELERIILDRDEHSAMNFLEQVVYPQVKESEKPGSCFHDPSVPVDRLERSVERQKKLGSF